MPNPPINLEFCIIIVSLLIIGILLVRGLRVCRQAKSQLAKEEKEFVEAVSTASGVHSVSRSENRAIRSLQDALRYGEWSADGTGYSAWISDARYIAGILVFVGLLGTVLGITVSLAGLSGTSSATGANVKENDLDLLLKQISAVLGGMRTATACTLFGILGTVVLSWENQDYSRRVSAFLDTVEKSWQETYRPTYVKAQEAQTRTLLGGEFANALRVQITESLIGTVETVIRSATGEVKNVLQESADSFLSNFRAATGSFASTGTELSTSISKLKEVFAGSATVFDEAAGKARTVVDALDQVRQQQEQATKSMTNAVTLLSVASRETEQSRFQQASAFGAQLEKQQQIADTLRNVIASLGAEREQTFARLQVEREQAQARFEQESQRWQQWNEMGSADRLHQTQERAAWMAHQETLWAQAKQGLESVLNGLEIAQTQMISDAAKERAAQTILQEGSRREATSLLQTSFTHSEQTLSTLQAEVLRAQRAAQSAAERLERLGDGMATQHQQNVSLGEALLAGMAQSDARLMQTLARFEETLAESLVIAEGSPLPDVVTQLAGDLERFRATVEPIETLLKQGISALNDWVTTSQAADSTAEPPLPEQQLPLNDVLSPLPDLPRRPRTRSATRSRPTTSPMAKGDTDDV